MKTRSGTNVCTAALAPFVVAVLAFSAVAVLEIAAPQVAAAVLTSWGMDPFRFPFLDIDTVLSALRCRRLGIDVFSTNPCDALGRVFDYSPLWLAAAVLPVTTGWIVPCGLAVDGLFLLSLLLLPPGRGSQQTVVIVLGVLSTPVVFAMERANNDLIIFVLAASMAVLAGRRRLIWRVVGYGGGLLAGLLKYYPLLLLALVCRERPRVFVAVAFACLLLLFGFVAVEFDDLKRALPLIPVGWYFSNMFGATILPFGIVHALALPPETARIGLLGMVVIALGAGAAIGLRAGVNADLDRLTEPERLFLLAGGLLILACFFPAQNIGYRALHLVLVLPGLTALARVGRYRTLYRLSVGVVLVLLWSQFWRHGLEAALQWRAPWEVLAPGLGTISLLAWMLRELCWWWTVTLLAGLCLGLLLSSQIGIAALPSLAGLARSSPRPAGISPPAPPPTRAPRRPARRRGR